MSGEPSSRVANREKRLSDEPVARRQPRPLSSRAGDQAIRCHWQSYTGTSLRDAVDGQATNLTALADLSSAWIDQVHARRPQTMIVLDLDRSVSEE